MVGGAKARLPSCHENLPRTCLEGGHTSAMLSIVCSWFGEESDLVDVEHGKDSGTEADMGPRHVLLPTTSSPGCRIWSKREVRKEDVTSLLPLSSPPSPSWHDGGGTGRKRLASMSGSGQFATSPKPTICITELRT